MSQFCDFVGGDLRLPTKIGCILWERVEMLRLGTFKVVGDGVHSVVVAGRFVKEQANVVLGNFSTSSFFASSSFAFTSAGDRVFNTGCSVPFDGAHY